jgi:hypothetical protein
VNHEYLLSCDKVSHQLGKKQVADYQKIKKAAPAGAA